MTLATMERVSIGVIVGQPVHTDAMGSKNDLTITDYREVDGTIWGTYGMSPIRGTWDPIPQRLTFVVGFVPFQYTAFDGYLWKEGTGSSNFVVKGAGTYVVHSMSLPENVEEPEPLDDPYGVRGGWCSESNVFPG